MTIPNIGQELIDQVNALSRPGTTGEAQYGAAGVTFDSPPPAHLAIFELTGPMVYPDLDGAPQDHFDREPTPSAPAKMVWCHQHRLADAAPDGTPIRSYGGIDHSPPETIWHPAARRNAAGYAFGSPTFAAGARVYCRWNRQSRRWEIEAPALNVWRVEVAGTLLPSQGQVDALVNDDQSDSQVTVHIPGPYFLGVGRAGAGGHAGTLAYAIWSPLRQRWEFLAGQFKLLAEGIAYEDIAPSQSGLVNLWWLDYVSGNLVDSGQQVTALNWLQPLVAAGEKVLISYDRQENRWTILAADFTTRPQTLDVVTSVDFNDHSYTTRSIELPPWTTIGPPVQY